MQESGPPWRQEFAAYFALLEVGALVQHGVEQQLRDEGGVTFVQFQVLAALGESRDGAQTMTMLADQLVHSRSGLTYQAQQLEKAGLLTRGTAADDERSVVLALTDTGRDVLARVLAGHVDLVRDLLNRALPPHELDQFTQLLTALRTHLRARPPRSANRRTQRPQQRPSYG